MTALLIVAGGVVAVRTSLSPRTLAFIGGAGRVAGAEVSAATATPPTAAAVLGPRALPLSNPTSLEATLAAAGYRLPPGAGVYAAKVTKEAGGLAYEDYQAGVGALGSNFWPASSIKVLAAVAALEYVGRQGFTGSATVAFGNGAPRTIRSIYDDAIRISDNAAYDLLVEVAGLDYLNGTFLTPARGFPVTVIQRSYTIGGNLRVNPAITLTEGGRKVVIPARTGRVDGSCPQGQCSNLFEMSESVRRLVLHNEIPVAERFELAPADVAGLNSALLGAEGWFEPAVARVLGSGARIYGKPGQVPGRDCLDVVLIERNNQRILLSATVPESQGGCPALVTLAQNVLRALAA
ncbi:MAG: class A beta-lactamase-related serine hydrolase [Actinomycetota bacterium]|nr:class A beta-lactamase-related serine hydrolase [Actinomycetota bacterium]